jgi:hypothetical protein
LNGEYLHEETAVFINFYYTDRFFYWLPAASLIATVVIAIVVFDDVGNAHCRQPAGHDDGGSGTVCRQRAPGL